jgi:hypothetical protein
MAVLALFMNTPTKASNVPDEIFIFQSMQSRGAVALAWGAANEHGNLLPHR